MVLHWSHTACKCFVVSLLVVSIPLTVYIAVPTIWFPDNQLLERIYQWFIIAIILPTTLALLLFDKFPDFFHDHFPFAHDAEELEEEFHERRENNVHLVTVSIKSVFNALAIVSIIGYVLKLVTEILFYAVFDCDEAIEMAPKYSNQNGFKFSTDIIAYAIVAAFFYSVLLYVKNNTAGVTNPLPSFYSFLVLSAAFIVFLKILLIHIQDTVEAILTRNDTHHHFEYNCSLKEKYEVGYVLYSLMNLITFNSAAEYLPLAILLIWEIHEQKHAIKVVIRLCFTNGVVPACKRYLAVFLSAFSCVVALIRLIIFTQFAVRQFSNEQIQIYDVVNVTLRCVGYVLMIAQAKVCYFWIVQKPRAVGIEGGEPAVENNSDQQPLITDDLYTNEDADDNLPTGNHCRKNPPDDVQIENENVQQNHTHVIPVKDADSVTVGPAVEHSDGHQPIQQPGTSNNILVGNQQNNEEEVQNPLRRRNPFADVGFENGQIPAAQAVDVQHNHVHLILVKDLDSIKNHNVDANLLWWSVLPTISVIMSHFFCAFLFICFSQDVFKNLGFILESFINIFQLWYQYHFLSMLTVIDKPDYSTSGYKLFQLTLALFCIANFIVAIYNVVAFKFIDKLPVPSATFLNDVKVLWVVLAIIEYVSSILFRWSLQVLASNYLILTPTTSNGHEEKI